MSEASELLVGLERERALLEFGFSRGFLEVLADPRADRVTSLVAASDGCVLAQIAHEPGVEGSLPAGRIAPVCHVDESQLVYDLLLEREGHWVLVRWSPESTEPFAGGVDGYLTDLVVAAWESDVVEDDELETWARRIGHPAPRRLLRELAAVSRTTLSEHRRWRDDFLASLPANGGLKA